MTLCSLGVLNGLLAELRRAEGRFRMVDWVGSRGEPSELFVPLLAAELRTWFMDEPGLLKAPLDRSRLDRLE